MSLIMCFLRADRIFSSIYVNTPHLWSGEEMKIRTGKDLGDFESSYSNLNFLENSTFGRSRLSFDFSLKMHPILLLGVWKLGRFTSYSGCKCVWISCWTENSEWDKTQGKIDDQMMGSVGESVWGGEQRWLMYKWWSEGWTFIPRVYPLKSTHTYSPITI